jgi:Fe-S cluster assembly iron-binding protein IscA
MVYVTERARESLRELLAESDDPSASLRLGTVTSGQLGVFRDRERADDQIVEHEGVAVLLIGKEIAPIVQNTTIDYDDNGRTPGLVIRGT